MVKTAENLRESPIRQQIPEKGKTKLDIILVTIAQSAKVPQKYAIQGSLYHFPQRLKVNVYLNFLDRIAQKCPEKCGEK